MAGLVSINIPFLNGFNLLRRCISCIKMFTVYEPYELVLIDDGSTEDGISEYAKLVANIYIRHDSIEGIAKSRADGVEQSNGEYICELDNDTVVTPNWLSRLVRTFEAYKNNEDYRIYILGALNSHRIGQFIKNNCILNKNGLLDREVVGTSGMLFEKSLVEKIGNFDPDLFNSWSDLDFCRRITYKKMLGENAKVATEPKVVVYHHGWFDPETIQYEETEDNINGRNEPVLAELQYKIKMLKSMIICKERWGLEHALMIPYMKEVLASK